MHGTSLCSEDSFLNGGVQSCLLVFTNSFCFHVVLVETLDYFKVFFEIGVEVSDEYFLVVLDL